MTEYQARQFLRDVDELPEELGAGWYFRGSLPCCAVGHLAQDSDVYTYKTTVGLDMDDEAALVTANDAAVPEERKARVVAAAERIVRGYGFDPATLREEGVA